MLKKDRLRLLTSECERCHLPVYQIGYLCLSGIWQIWCPDCILRGLLDPQSTHQPGLDLWTCEKCDRTAYMVYYTARGDRKEYWCEQCVQNVLPAGR